MRLIAFSALSSVSIFGIVECLRVAHSDMWFISKFCCFFRWSRNSLFLWNPAFQNCLGVDLRMFLWISPLLHAYGLISRSTLPSHLAVIFVVPFVIVNNLSSWKGVVKQTKNRLLIASDRAGPRHVSTPGRLAIWRVFKQTFFKLFGLSIGLGKILEGACPNLGFFGKILSRVETLV